MIVVVGLAFEAKIVADAGMRVICSGDGRNLAASLTQAIDDECGGLISFGVAGGLHPDLEPGTCVVAAEILSGSARFPTDPTWSRKLADTIPGAVRGAIVGVPKPVAHTAAKRSLHDSTGALAVDMESHIVAEIGAAHALPVAAIRVITDPADRALPKAALAAMRPNGTTDILAMVRQVMRQPKELPALMRTALDARAARATLVRGRRLLGPGLGLAEFAASATPSFGG
ncbi:phosphorylase [Rhodoplanes elegans]|uniref:phosphorylase n=1 Tax=Rhodoplanes elegans TaxID=29408 RepID=UPI0019138096|nr:phosphorylase [Rhodoplanes elegans]